MNDVENNIGNAGESNIEISKDDFDNYFVAEQESMLGLLPEEYTDIYNVLSMMSETKLHKSYLLEDKKQHFKVILKTGEGDSSTLLKTEAEVGEKARAALAETDGRVISYREIDGIGYLLRHYIEGMNLIEYVERRMILSAEEIYDILRILCYKVSILHELNPPVIHRDIKPENIIVRAKRGRIIDVYVIDYGTARVYDEGKEHDTVFVASRQTAAPEQYGFSQTDARTDVYGLGKVLCYMLTGGFDSDAFKDKTYKEYRSMGISTLEYNALSRTVVKATSLDPDKRYDTVKLFWEACIKGCRMRKYGMYIAACLVGLIVIVGAYNIGAIHQKNIDRADDAHEITAMNDNDVGAGDESNSELQDGSNGETDAADSNKEQGVDEYSDDEYDGDGKNEMSSETADDAIADNQTNASASDNEVDTDKSGSVIFESELLKEAVLRNLPSGTVITKETLSKVRSIRIIGKKCFGYDNEIWAYKDMVLVDGGAYPNSDVGDVTDLSLIASMDNLEELYLANQGLTDISALRGCPVKTLFLNGNNIEDFSVLETMPNLENLFIGNNPISKLPNLAGCGKLRMLNLDHLFLDNIEPLKGLNIYELEMLDIHVLDNDYSSLKELSSMYRLNLGDPESGVIKVLGELNNVKDLSIDSWPKDNIDEILGMSKLDTFSMSSQYIEDLSGIEKLSGLEKIYLDGSPNIIDVSGIEKLPHLQEFSTTSSMIEDVTPICILPDTVWCIRLRNEVADKVLKKKPELEGRIFINY